MRSAWFIVFCACAGERVIALPVSLKKAVTAEQIKSYELWVIDQLDRNDQPIDCAQLASRAATPGEQRLQILKGPLIVESLDPLDLRDIPVGARNRIFYADFYDAPGATGERVAVGCAGGQSVDGRETLTVRMQVTDTPEVGR